MDAQYAHSCTETANQVISLSKEHSCTAIILIGEARLSRSIEAAMPRDVRQHVISIQEDFTGLTGRELEKRLEPIIEEWERKHQAAVVSEFLDGDRGTVTGIEESLFAPLMRPPRRGMVLGNAEPRRKFRPAPVSQI
jgi:hypothetical protein